MFIAWFHVLVTVTDSCNLQCKKSCTLRLIDVHEVQLSLSSNLWSAGGGIRGRHAARLWSRRGHVGQRDDCSRGEERLGHWYRGGWGSCTTVYWSSRTARPPRYAVSVIKSAYSGLRGSNCHSLNSLQCVVFANIAVSQNRLQIPAKNGFRFNSIF